MLQRIDTFSRSVPALRTTGAGSKRHRVSLEWLICGDLTGLLQTVGDRSAGDCPATQTDRAAAKSGRPKTGNSGDCSRRFRLHSTPNC
jgi:hypothetical protein